MKNKCLNIIYLVLLAIGLMLMSAPASAQQSGTLPSLGKVASPVTGNLARSKPAQQSSRSQWSRTNDPQGAVDGVINGSYGFHTNREANPWWQVDLGAMTPLAEVRVYNRLDSSANRARTLSILLSDNGRAWRTAYRHNGSTFGGKNGKPLKVPLQGQLARYVRLQLNETTWFHLDEVEVYGQSGSGPTAKIAQIHGKVTLATGPRESRRARVIIGTGFNYRGPSEVAVHELRYKKKIADMRTDEQGQFVVNLPPGKYDVFIWKECYVPKIYRNVTLTSTLTLNTQLGRGTNVLGSHCPSPRLTGGR